MRKKIRGWVDELKGLHGSPHEVAIGASVGTFISVMPTPGLNILLGVVFLFAYPKVNKLALFLPFAIWNPFTVLLLYPASYHLGELFFGTTNIVLVDLSLMDQIFHYSRRFLVGHTIVSFVLASLTYAVVFWLVARDPSCKQ